MLVMVVAMLGVLFVIGVAFMATMNFEADSIAAQAKRGGEENAVESIAVDLGSTLRDSFVTAPTQAFSDSIAAAATAPFAELPYVHNSYSPIEPVVAVPGDDGIAGTADANEAVGFIWYTDVPAARNRPFTGPTLPPSFGIGVDLAQGQYIYNAPLVDDTGAVTDMYVGRCVDGSNLGPPCGGGPNSCVPPFVCVGQRLIDSDGDGIVDSVQFSAANLGLSTDQLAALAAQVNPTSRPDGEVYAAVRVVPHGGLVNLNQSHPNLINNVFDLGLLPTPTSVVDATRRQTERYFYHGPTRARTSYPTLQEEPILRSRVLLPSEDPPPSVLQGNPFVDVRSYPGMKADMAQFLMPPLPTGEFEAVSRMSGQYQFKPFVPCAVDAAAGCLGASGLDRWQVRMEPLTARLSNTNNDLRDYDRRHLVTTVSHDDLLSRGARVQVRELRFGETQYAPVDILTKMREANDATWSANYTAGNCPVLQFEYADYPQDVPNKVLPQVDGVAGAPDCACPNSPACSFDPRKGRLQLSLPWLDQAMKVQPGKTLPLLWENNNEPIQAMTLIADVFATMLQNLIGPDWEYRRALNPTTNLFEVRACTDNDECADGEYCRRAASGTTGRCSAVAPYWDDVECSSDNDCVSGEICVALPPPPPPIPAPSSPINLCHDSWTGQRHSQALLSRTAASLTANLLDFADADDVPSRVALRSFDFNRGKCGGVSGNPFVELPCTGLINGECGAGTCVLSPYVVGDEIDAWPGVDHDSDGDQIDRAYVYGLERQPYITAVATKADVVDTDTSSDFSPADVADFAGWAVEIFNPHTASLPTAGTYFLYEVRAGANDFAGEPRVQLPTAVAGDPTGDGQFTIFYSENGATSLFGALPTTGGDVDLKPVPGAPAGFQLAEGSTLYLVLSYTYPGDGTTPTEIVLDQFSLPAVGSGTNIGVYGRPPPNQGEAQLGDNVYVLSRAVPDPTMLGTSKWLATVPVVGPEGWAKDATTGLDGLAGPKIKFGNWRTPTDSSNPPGSTYPLSTYRNVHPVEVNFANTGVISDPTDLGQPIPPAMSKPKSAFPTTGSLLLLMRHANRGVIDLKPSRAAIGLSQATASQPTQPVTQLAFTSKLNEQFTYRIGTTAGVANAVVDSFAQIDNGRLPIYDTGVIDATYGRMPVHRVPPWITPPFDPTQWNLLNPASRPKSGDLNALPWGQMIFDYFTALPLANPGPYPACQPNDPNCPETTVSDQRRIDLATAVPRVDLGGLRVHGRINLNAAPPKVLAGLPYVPLDRIPSEFQATLLSNLSLPAFALPNYSVGSLGDLTAQGVAAYRESREIRFLLDPRDPSSEVSTGGYGDSPDPTATPAPPLGFRGWTMQRPEVRRGAGFMTVGELANVRHPQALPAALRTDWGEIDDTANDNNAENFIAAAAPLIALGDWVTVRSQVFTVYGVFRGEDDESIKDPNTAKQMRLRTKDVDSRAIRFQETIDRLPTFLGEPVPVRVGDRTIARYMDLRND